VSESPSPPAPRLTWKSHTDAELSADGRSVKKTGPDAWNCNILATQGSSKGVHEWTVRRDVNYSAIGFMIGVATSALNPTVNRAYGVDGLYFFCSRAGQLCGQYPNGGSISKLIELLLSSTDVLQTEKVANQTYGVPVTKVSDLFFFES
jgi:hypothetical protein